MPISSAITTPKKRIFGAPGTPSPSTQVMRCTAQPTGFSDVTIHTAKCSSCDQRNSSTMRRCPGCTWQICETCIHQRETQGKIFEHGNMDSPSPAIRATPVRRILFNPGSSTGSAAAGEDTGSQTPFPTLNLEKPAAPANCGLNDKRNGKAKVFAVSKDEHKSENYNPDRKTDGDGDFKTTTTSRASKRPRLAKLCGSTEGLSLPCQLTRGRCSTLASASTPALFETKYEKELTHLWGRSPTESITARQKSDSGAAKFMENIGICKHYTTHLLSRPTPIFENPNIIIPNNIANNFEKSPTAAEIQRRMVDKVKTKLYGGCVAREHPCEIASGHASGHFSYQDIAGEDRSLDNTGYWTVHDFAQAEYEKHLQGTQLDNDQRQTLLFAMLEVACKFANNTRKSQSEFLQKYMSPGLQLQTQALTDDQKKGLTDTIAEKANQTLKEFEEEVATFGKVHPRR